MKPTLVHPPPAAKPEGTACGRALRALRSGRLPTRCAKWLDRLATLLGRPCRRIHVEKLVFLVRRLQSDEFFVRDVVQRGEYDRSGYEIGPGETIVDVGANIGAFAVHAARQASGVRVVAVEPVQENFRLLTENLALNRVEGAEAVRAAVVGKPRHETVMHLSRGASGGHSLIEDLVPDRRREERVPAITLPDLMSEQRIDTCDLLKLDCEGAEFEILAHLFPREARRIRRVIVEYHARPGRDKEAEATELLEQLQQLGFAVDDYTDVVGTGWGLIFARRAVADENREGRA